jgi:hypothetical protein
MKSNRIQKALLFLIILVGIVGVASSVFQLKQTEGRLIAISKRLENVPGIMQIDVLDGYPLCGYLKDTFVNVSICKVGMQLLLLLAMFLLGVYFFFCLR